MTPASESFPSSERIRRRRVATTCTTCRDRRVKCDRSRPVCSPCTKGGKSCKYTDQDKRKVEFVTQRQDSFTRSEEDAGSASGTWGHVLESQVDFLKKAEKANKGAPVWAVAEALASRPQVLEPYASLSRPCIIPIKALGEEFVTEITKRFPSREVCQPFFESFLLGVHPVVPVSHIPTLRQQYEEFWAMISPSYSVESLTLMLAVLYTGAANAPHVDILNCSTLLQLYEEISGMVDFASHHPRNVSASIQLLQGCTIMNTYKASRLAPFSAFGFLPQVVRFAQALRLHTDTNQGDPIELEVRRRIWWHLLSLDIESTIATGLPTIIHRTGYTTQLPAMQRRYDSALASIDGLASSNISAMSLALQGHYKWAHCMQTWFATLPSREEVSSFRHEIICLVDLIPDKHAESEWARTYLKMQIDRAYCMLGLRFWQIDEYKGTGCHDEVVETARSFLRHYLQLSTSPAMIHFSWFMPGIIQPIHALIILLMHLSTCPKICEEESSRYLLDQIMSLRVNRILRGSVIPTKALLRGEFQAQRANPRYLIMAELRRRVWKKLGWDTDGKGKDPWAEEKVQGKVVGGVDGNEEIVPDQQQEMERPHGDAAMVEGLNEGWDINDSTGLEGLDNILAGDPMDLFQWDKWESLASDFFAS